MNWFNNLIANILPIVPRPIVKILSRPYIAGETLDDAEVTLSFVKGVRVGNRELFKRNAIRRSDDFFGKMNVGKEYHNDGSCLSQELFSEHEASWIYSIVGTNYNDSKSI